MATTFDTAGALAASPADALTIRRIGLSDLRIALARGFEDFLAIPTQLLFLGLIYPIVGLIAARAAYGGDMLPLLWPLVAGLSLLGPVAALGVTELSRRREKGETLSWLDAFSVLRSPAILSIAAIALLLLVIFLVWLLAAHLIWQATFGSTPPASLGAFIDRLTGTREGRWLLLLGNGVGFVFAVLVLSLTVIAFPLLLDRGVGADAAMRASLRAVRTNPLPMAAWGLIVAVLLFCGAVPAFVGLAIVVPLLGHATWHLYRRVVA